MSEVLIPGLPSATVVASACGLLVVTVGALLLQRAARAHLHSQRCDELQKRVSRVEARWHEAAR